MTELRSQVVQSLKKMFDGGLPYSQTAATAFAAVLTWALTPQSARKPVLYGAPHKDETKQLLSQNGISYESNEWMIDFLVAEQESLTKRIPLVACESEMYPDHGVDYSFSISYDKKIGRPYHDNDYVWDFCKLLHFRAPHLLFAARLFVCRMDRLETTLRECALEYCSLWDGCRLSIVLLPASGTRPSQVRLGTSTSAGHIDFQPLMLEK